MNRCFPPTNAFSYQMKSGCKILSILGVYSTLEKNVAYLDNIPYGYLLLQGFYLCGYVLVVSVKLIFLISAKLKKQRGMWLLVGLQ